MKNYIKLFAVSAIAMGAASTATAGEADEKIVFKYDASAPAAQTYEVLQAQAVKACNATYENFAHYATRKCVKRYVGQAVEKINAPELIAMHKGEKFEIENFKTVKMAEAVKKPS